MTIQRIEQVSSGLSKLLEQFKDKPNINSTLTAYLDQVQDTQETYEQMLDERNVTSAVGVQLDQIGSLVGEERQLREDEEYRAAIIVRIFINTADGTLPSVAQAAKLVTGATNVRIVEHYPASVYMYLEMSTIPPSYLNDLIQSILPAGVSLGYIGYGDNPLVFTPYDQEYADTNLLTNNDDFFITNEDEPLAVTRALQGSNSELAYLAEQLDPSSGYGILAETI